MKILVAGGAGYIGSRLIPELIKHGYKVTVLDLFWFGNHLPDSVTVINKDILKANQEDIEGNDIVIFLGGLSNDPMAEFSPSLNFVYNAAAPAYLAYISKKAGIRKFIYAGSCSVYGFTEGKLFTEEDPTISDYPYGISKLQGEVSVHQLQDKNFSTICFRQGTVGGYSPRMRLDLIVNTMYKTALSEGKIIVNNPNIWRPLLSISDAVKAYIKAIEAPLDITGTFNILTENATILEIGTKIHEILSITNDIKLIVNNIIDYRNYRVDNAKAITVLNWYPESSLEKMVQELITNHNKFKDLTNPQYYNIKVFQTLNL